MIKKLFSLGWLLVCLTYFHIGMGQTQENVVVLVDVSGSVHPTAASEAKELIKELVVNSTFSQNRFPNWSFGTCSNGSSLKAISEGKQVAPLVGSNKKVYLRTFGNKNRARVAPHRSEISDPLDFAEFIDEHYPRSFSDGFTYISLAKAQAARDAFDDGLCSYLLIEATDNKNDYTGEYPNDDPNYTESERSLIDVYDLQGQIDKSKICYINFSKDRNFRIIISRVILVECGLPDNPQEEVVPPTELALPSVVINSMSKSEKAPSQRKLPTTLSWSCRNCPEENMKYRVIISKKVGGSYTETVVSKPNVEYTQLLIREKDLGGSSGSFKVQITAMGPSIRSIRSGEGYFKMGGGNGGFFPLFLFLVIMGLGGRYVYTNFLKPSNGGRNSNNNSSTEAFEDLDESWDDEVDNGRDW